MDKTRVLLCLFVPKAITVYSNKEMGRGSKERNILLLHVPTEILKNKKKGKKK